MTGKELTRVGRLVARVVRFAQQVLAEANTLGMTTAPRRRKRRTATAATAETTATKPARKSRGTKTPLRRTAEEE